MGVGLSRSSFTHFSIFFGINLPNKLALSQLLSPVPVVVLCFNKSKLVTGCQLLLIDPGKHISQLA